MKMNIVSLEKMWESVIAKTHNTKPTKTNLFEREMLLALQVLLGQYELAKSEKNDELMKFCADVLKTYEKYNINGHIVWNK